MGYSFYFFGDYCEARVGVFDEPVFHINYSGVRVVWRDTRVLRRLEAARGMLDALAVLEEEGYDLRPHGRLPFEVDRTPVHEAVDAVVRVFGGVHEKVVVLEDLGWDVRRYYEEAIVSALSRYLGFVESASVSAVLEAAFEDVVVFSSSGEDGAGSLYEFITVEVGGRSVSIKSYGPPVSVHGDLELFGEIEPYLWLAGMLARPSACSDCFKVLDRLDGGARSDLLEKVEALRVLAGFTRCASADNVYARMLEYFMLGDGGGGRICFGDPEDVGDVRRMFRELVLDAAGVIRGALS